MKCNKCGITIKKKLNRSYQCVDCYRDYMIKWRKENKSKTKEYSKIANAKRKLLKPDEVKKYDRDYKRTIYHTDVEYRERIKERVRRGRQKYRATIERKRREIKQDVIDAYGGKCACCGIDNYEFMAIDHINGGGNKHRKENKTGSGLQFYRWLKKQNYPKGFRVLCHNCNMSYGMYGYCPHTSESKYGKNAYK